MTASPNAPVPESSASRRVDMSDAPRMQVYRSAVDWWLAVLLASPIVIATAIGIILILNGRAADASSMFLTAAAVLIATGVFVVPCRYTFLQDALSIRCGVICYQVPYHEILSVQRTSTLRSGPALSLRRVAIETDSREHVVSPVLREKFIEQLRARIGG
ncbi:PH domain-containing protein [Allorhodopirellula solitaria]|uniref:PH domain-containing protein n=1 Tax=Allorhodopirellula solitaria TaxID=2527987 RepID=UPI001FEBE17D|nr:PH domain-containing protein [Allorhodopirellula solitaria]